MSYMFDGKIDEVMIFNLALTDAEISAIYSGVGISPKIEYDLAGNMTKDQRGYLYSWDYNNHLTGIKRADGTNVALYTYDALGRRVIKRLFNSAGTEISATRYFYNGWQLLQENYVQGGVVSTCDFVYGNALDEVVLHEWSNQTAAMYYINDHLNSPAALVNGSTGAVAQRYEYDAYGARHVFDAGLSSELTATDAQTAVGFTGQRLEVLDNGGLQIAYYKNRWYDPESGRFMSQDPLGCEPGGYENKFYPKSQFNDGLNLYGYAHNMPLVRSDIYGLDSPNCDIPGHSWGNHCWKRCCAKHDQCYLLNGCTAKSWTSCQGGEPCDKCNSDAALCFLSNVLCGWSDTPDEAERAYYGPCTDGNGYGYGPSTSPDGLNVNCNTSGNNSGRDYKP